MDGNNDNFICPLFYWGGGGGKLVFTQRHIPENLIFLYVTQFKLCSVDCNNFKTYAHKR